MRDAILKEVADVLRNVNVDAEYFADGDWREPPVDDVLRRIAAALDARADVKKLVPLDEWNAKRDSLYDDANEPRANGIACPECSHELIDSRPGITLTSHPPQKNVACLHCGWTGRRTA